MLQGLRVKKMIMISKAVGLKSVKNNHMGLRNKWMNQSIWIFLREHTKDIIEKQTADLTKY